MTKLFVTFLSLAFISLAAAPAQAGVARHERVQLKEIKKDGKVVGVKLSLTIRPEGHKAVRIGIAPHQKPLVNNNYQPAASDIKNGHLTVQFPEIKLENNEPKKAEFKVMFKNHPELKPGAAIEVISAFPRGSGGSWHVYGLTRRAQPGDKFTVPGKAASKRKTGITEIKRSAKRSAPKTARQRDSRRTRAKTARRTSRSKSRSQGKPAKAR